MVHVTGTVKWFDGTKGFGFITLDDPYKEQAEGNDVFFHFETLKRAKVTSAHYGDALTFILGKNAKGWLAQKIVSHSSATPKGPEGPATAPREVPILVTVKFFNSDPKKNYGFLTPKDGGPDIFIHRSTLEESGFADLTEGEELLVMDYTTGFGDKRDQATRIVAP